MNFQSDDGSIQNSDPAAAWNLPYACRWVAFQELVKNDWSQLSKKYKDPNGMLKELQGDVEQNLKLSGPAQDLFGLKNDRDPVAGLGQ